MDVVIIGGGASGMIAAITAAENKENKVTILERQSRVGRKLSATGNGRCNLTNRCISGEHYHGRNPAFAETALRMFDYENTLQFFYSLGLICTEEPSGRVYPFSDQAGSVVDVLRLTCDDMGVKTVTGIEIRNVSHKKDGFQIEGVSEGQQTFIGCQRLIIACGGMAGGKLGGTDSGYRLLERFGHTRTKLRPALVQIGTNAGIEKSLKGIRSECKASLLKNGNTVNQESGEVQFTEFGLSGPCIFDLTARNVIDVGHTIELDLLPTLPEAELKQVLQNRCARFPGRTCENLLTGILQNRLGRTVVKSCGIGFEQLLGSLTDKCIENICNQVKHFCFTVTGTLGFDQAQVTAGGIRTEEFEEATMQSKLCRGLYACGEVLDIDGDCGGYNLQWAWSSGRLAGKLLGG